MSSFAQKKLARTARQSSMVSAATTSSELGSLSTVPSPARSPRAEHDQLVMGSAKSSTNTASPNPVSDRLATLDLDATSKESSPSSWRKRKSSSPPNHRDVDRAQSASLPSSSTSSVAKENEMFGLASASYEVRVNGQKGRSLWATKRFKQGRSHIFLKIPAALMNDERLNNPQYQSSDSRSCQCAFARYLLWLLPLPTGNSDSQWRRPVSSARFQQVWRMQGRPLLLDSQSGLFTFAERKAEADIYRHVKLAIGHLTGPNAWRSGIFRSFISLRLGHHRRQRAVKASGRCRCGCLEKR